MKAQGGFCHRHGVRAVRQPLSFNRRWLAQLGVLVRAWDLGLVRAQNSRLGSAARRACHRPLHTAAAKAWRAPCQTPQAAPCTISPIFKQIMAVAPTE